MAAMTNVRLGELLGVSFATASRICSGDRLPSIVVMYRIKELWGWSMDDQVEARLAGTYHEHLTELIKRQAPNVTPPTAPGQ